jgi:hypothetical protein
VRIVYRNFLATINTAVILTIAIILCDYVSSAKKLNLAAEKRLKHLDEAIVSPLSEKLLPAVISTIEGLRKASPFAIDTLKSLEVRHDENKKFALKVLDVLAGVDGVIFAVKDENNKESIHRWVQRAKYEAGILSLLSWNERDVLYRLSKKDIGLTTKWFKPVQPEWMVQLEGRKKPLTLYKWFYGNKTIAKYLHEIDLNSNVRPIIK